MKISICLIAAVFSFLCALNGTKGQPNLEIAVVQKVKDYGQNLQLFCKIDKCCQMDAGWTVDGATIFIDIKRSMQTINPNSKYNATYDDNGMRLIIKNFSRGDLNKTYECTYEFSSVRKYLLYDDVFSSQPNLEIVVVKKVNDYGQNLQLFCKIYNCCKMDAGWTVDGATLFIDIKRFIQTMDPNSKYNATYDDSGMSLIIKNLSKGDLNKTYECTYEFSSVRKALLYDDVFSNNAPQVNDQRNDLPKIVSSIVGSAVGIAVLVACLIFLIRYTKCCIKENRKSQKKRNCFFSEEGHDESVPFNPSEDTKMEQQMPGDKDLKRENDNLESKKSVITNKVTYVGEATGTGLSDATTQGVKVKMTEANTKLMEPEAEQKTGCYPSTADTTFTENRQKLVEKHNIETETQTLRESQQKLTAELSKTMKERDDALKKIKNLEKDKEDLTKNYDRETENRQKLVEKHNIETETQTLRESQQKLTAELSKTMKERDDALKKIKNLEKDKEDLTKNYDRETENRQKLVEKHNIETETQTLRESQQKLTAELSKTMKERDDALKKIKNLEKDQEDLTKNYDRETENRQKLVENNNAETKILRETVQTLKEELNKKMNERDDALNKINNLEKDKEDLTKNYDRETTLRKKYYNMVQDMKGKIRVYCRVRPMSSSENARVCKSVCKAQDEYSLIFQTKRGYNEYMFDQVFMEDSTQEKIFEDTKNLIVSAVDGFNVCIFAYGQTGSGKTYTIIGDKEQNHPGIAPKAFERIFELKGDLRSTHEINVFAYMLELYNDRLIDLLAKPGICTDVKIRVDEKGLFRVEGAVTKQVYQARELFVLFKKGFDKRQTSSTQMNDESSRSHLVISIVIESTNKTTRKTHKGKLSLVDLAGSERAEKSKSNQQQADEAIFINTALLELGKVISACSNNQPHIPYRNNKLTMLMKDSIGGNSKTLMFVNISPAECNQEESISSLTVFIIQTFDKINAKAGMSVEGYETV